LAIGPRTGLKPAISLTSVHVLASRVRLSKNLYVIGFDPKTDSEHLRKLPPSPVLAIWEAGYNAAGFWDAAKAAAFASRLAIAEAQAAKQGRNASRRKGGGQGSGHPQKRAADSATGELPAKKQAARGPFDGASHSRKRSRTPK